MSLKEELVKLRKKIVGEEAVIVKKEPALTRKVITPCVTAKSLSLDAKVENFAKWYYQNMVVGHFTAVGECHAVKELKNLIEKMAVWYELRYPDYSINRMFPGSTQENLDVSNIMFQNNKYINEQLDESDLTRVLDWGEFYNIESFIEALPCEERYFFSKPNYKSIVYIDSNTHLHLTETGIVEEAEWFGFSTGHVVDDKDLEGMHVREVIQYLKKMGIVLPPNNELEQMLQDIDKHLMMQEGLLDSVMYRIIERGGNRIGPRRGFLFAQEFKRNIDIPVMYGADYSDPGLRRFINEYIKAGGSKELVCYSGYFTCTNQYSILGVTTVEKILNSQWNNGLEKYTPEETLLHQRLVNVLVSQIDPKVVRKEKAKQLRIERKLEKSRNRNN